MDPHTGQIKSFDTKEEANAAGYTVDLSNQQAKMMFQMTEQARIVIMKRKEEFKKKQKVAKKVAKSERQKLKAARKDERNRRNKNRS